MAKVLVVDNNVTDRINILNALEPSGHNIEEVSDGQEALDSVDRDAPDCIVIELVLLGMDGFKVIRALRAKGLAMPIIVLTNQTKDAMRDIAMDAGATVFLRKPMNPNTLVETVRELVKEEKDESA